MEPREVCKICYNSTSHKPTPTLTYQPKEHPADSLAPLECAVCRQEWAPIRVAKELGSNRWVRIRPRPKLQMYIDFMLCKNLKGRAECPRGQDCSFAHSQAELWAWNQERQKEPRPAPQINGSYQYQLCKYISKSGNCPYGNKCTFAHTEEELQAWLKVQGGVGGSASSSNVGSWSRSSSGSYGSGVTFKCNVCQQRYPSKKVLEEHINNSRHRQQYQWSSSNVGGVRQPTGTTSNRFTAGTSSASGQSRPRPTLSFQISGFRLCVHVQNGRRCLYGDYCTFAHSQAELDDWNQVSKANSSVSMRSASRSESESRGTTPTSQGPVEPEKPIQLPNGIKGDFAGAIRQELSKEHKGHKEHFGVLEASREGVTVNEVTDTALALTTSNTAPFSWVFEITTSVTQVLQSVVMFDTLNSDFYITYVLKHISGSWEKVPVHGQAEQGVGMLLDYKMLPSDKLQVKVTVTPRSGLLGQVLVFQFGSFRIVQCLLVRIISESEEKLRYPKPRPVKRPANIDLFWENHYSKIAMENMFEEDQDRHLPEYFLPQQIENLIEKGKYSNVEIKVTKENYRRRMHNLLYLEEYQQRVDLSRYDLYDVEVQPLTQYTSAQGGLHLATKGFHFITLSIDELLFEGGQSVRPGDLALLLPSNQQVMHECVVEHVGRESVILKITEKAKQASAASRFRVSIRFLLGRIPMRSMHYAVDQLDLDIIFPAVQHTPESAIPTSTSVQSCLETLKESHLNPFQLQAITSMLDPSCLKIPSLVLGPFGCGKTHTLSECIMVLAKHIPSARVLVCTHSNSAADIYVESMDTQWSRSDDGPLSLCRLYFTMRRLNSISPTVRKYCKISKDNSRLLMPSLSELKSHRIVVSTLSTARALTLMEMPKGHFTHIFIDEAAQALESEALIPLCLANAQTKIVLAGDHMQLDPPVYSDIARKYGLHVSLLERLFDLDVYEGGVGQLCKTLLTENHRSHQLILDLPSQLFYKDKLSCKAKFPPGGPDNLPAVKFVCVDGQEEQNEDSPSFYNNQEALKVAEEARLLTEGGLRGQDICVLTYYSKQVRLIRNVLRGQGLGQVIVCRVDDVQGKEFRALIISTVRTLATEPRSEKEAGFLTNPKLFNTAVTRARQWLIVVGEPVTLCTIGSNRLCWLEYIRRCIGLKSFDHSNPAQFTGRLDYKMITRQLMEENYPKFFKSTQRGPTVSTPTSQQFTFEPSKRSQAPSQSVGIADKGLVGGGAPAVSVASKVLDTPLQVGKDLRRELPAVVDKAVPNVSSPAMNLPALTNHSTLQLSSQPAPPSHLNHTPTLLTNSTPAYLDETGVEDLPVFLSNMVESLKMYSGWCEQMLGASYPLKISSSINNNLQSQKSLLEKQTQLVQQQIQLYREYVKLHPKDTANGGHASMSSSSTQQFHFPSALPPPNSRTLSGSLDFPYDNSYFTDDRSLRASQT